MSPKLRKYVKEIALKTYADKFEKSIETSFKKKNLKWCDKVLTPTQEKEVQDYYIAYAGRKINLDYHRYFYSRNGYFSPRYIPTSFYKAHIIGRLNDLRMADAYVDKNQYERLFPQIKHPKSLIKCIGGYYYHKGTAITEENAIQICSNLNNVIIKPALESIYGSKVACISTKNGKLDSGKSIKELFEMYGKHFIIQERIQQHEKLSVLNPTSVNSIRLLTYRRENTVEVLYTVVRIGRKGKIIDNESSGGVTAKINSNGRIEKYLYGSSSEGVLERTDTGIVVEGHEIPSYSHVTEIVKQLHLQLPYFNLVGWDIAIGKDGEPIFIEWNVRSELSQSAVGPAFGEFTEEILSTIKTHPTTRYIALGKGLFNQV